MIHYSCDRCGRPIDPSEDLRYVVRLEIEAVMEPLDGEVVDDDDRDHLMELHEILDHADDVRRHHPDRLGSPHIADRVRTLIRRSQSGMFGRRPLVKRKRCQGLQGMAQHIPARTGCDHRR